MRVLQVLYSGLGGHGSVFMSFVEGDVQQKVNHAGLFFGTEEIKPDYKEFCRLNNTSCFEVRKKEGIDFSSWEQVYKVLKKQRPDAILLHSLNLLHVALFYWLLHKTKLVVVEHTPLITKTKAEWLFSGLAMLLAPKIVLLTDQYYESLKNRLGLFFRKEKITVINNGINLQRYKPSVLSLTPKKEFVISMVARFSVTKDQQTLVEAFAELLTKFSSPVPIKLHLAGSGENLAAIKSLVKNLGIQNHVVFNGLLSETEIITFLQTTDIYVHSSFSETMSTAVMQALAVGLPVIGSDINGINNIIKAGKTGLLFPVSDKGELAEKLLYLLQNPSERVKLAAAAREHASRNFSHQVMFNQYFALLR